jgi:predicted RNA-binding Zn ribbon-like protein
MTDTLPFKYVAGDSSLDFVNTVDWTDRGLRNERIAEYDDLVRWAEKAGIVSHARAQRLRTLARRTPRGASRAYRHALQLRSALQRVMASVAHTSHTRDARLDAAGMRELNAWLSRALEHLRLAPAQRDAAFSWSDADTDLESPLWPIVWSSAQLIASEESKRIRVCAGRNCGWMYVDRSRNGLRRWCEMSTCGTQEKSLRRRRRRARRAR